MTLLPSFLSKKIPVAFFVILAVLIVTVNSGFFVSSSWWVVFNNPHEGCGRKKLVAPVWADDEAEKIERELEDRLEEKEDLENALSDLEKELARLNEDIEVLGGKLFLTQRDLDTVAAQAQTLGEQIAALEVRISEMREELAAKERLRNRFVRLLYKERRTPHWEVFFRGEGLSRLSKSLVYQSVTIFDLKEKIASLNADILTMEENKRRLAESKAALDLEVARIAALKEELSRQKAAAEAEAAEAARRRDALSNELLEISAEIRNLVRAKLAATAEGTSVGDTEPLREEVPNPPFSPAYAVYSRGYPHRVGMNQYGAYGRAKSGQSYEEILKAYYKDVKIEDYDCPEKIKIRGSFGEREIDFEDDYLKGIAEMPSSWGEEAMEALKAQAVAARTYALAYTRGGEDSICITQSCQVYRESKVHSEAAENWHRAVEETRGKVITYDGSPIKAWYASTAGGATRLPTDFDVKWNSTPPYIKRIIDNPEGKMDRWADSYDRDSPWFYKAWYDSSYDKHPWLREEEMEDLLNAALLLSEDSDLEDELVQEDPVVSSKAGWSKEKVREELEKRGLRPVGEIEEILCVDSSEGYTKTVTVVSENYGDGKSIDGKVFRKIFVIRSRGHLALWSSLYDIVKK